MQLNPKWEDNSIQFPRLLAEICANGILNKEAYAVLQESMDLEASDIDEILIRAVEEWDQIKAQI